MSMHSQFRLNQQYLFFLLNAANMRQLNAGVFYKMNVSKVKGKLTAGEYINKLKSGELEGDLAAIFSRIRNIAAFWVQPRNENVCMTDHFGPATWFLTMSPGDFEMEALADYIRDCNSMSWKNKSISELIALDPVSASRYIDNQFQAMLDFLLSEDAPLGRIILFFFLDWNISPEV